MTKLNFYFDFLSPYSYFAWIKHKEEIFDKSLEISYKPVLMGKLFSHHEFKGPGEIIVKRNYELKKCFRIASKKSIPFTPPSSFPFNPMAIIRLATKYASQEKQIEVIDIIFKAVWSKGIILEDPDLVEKYLQDHSFPGEIFARSFERDAKAELKANIKDALSAQIFGVPTFQVEDEYFWGYDSITQLNDYLAQNDNWDIDLYNKLTK